MEQIFATWRRLDLRRQVILAKPDKFLGLRPVAAPNASVWQKFDGNRKTSLSWSWVDLRDERGTIETKNIEGFTGMPFRPATTGLGGKYFWVFWDEYHQGSQ